MTVGCHVSKIPIIIALHNKCDSPVHILYGPSQNPPAKGSDFGENAFRIRGLPPHFECYSSCPRLYQKWSKLNQHNYILKKLICQRFASNLGVSF